MLRQTIFSLILVAFLAATVQAQSIQSNVIGSVSSTNIAAPDGTTAGDDVVEVSVDFKWPDISTNPHANRIEFSLELLLDGTQPAGAYANPNSPSIEFACRASDDGTVLYTGIRNIPLADSVGTNDGKGNTTIPLDSEWHTFTASWNGTTATLSIDGEIIRTAGGADPDFATVSPGENFGLTTRCNATTDASRNLLFDNITVNGVVIDDFDALTVGNPLSAGSPWIDDSASANGSNPASFTVNAENSTIIAGPPIDYADPNCMLVVRAADLSNGFDQAINNRLLSLGYIITIVEGGAFTQAEADSLNAGDFGVLVVSESISSSNVDELTGVNVPMMHNEPFGWDNLGFADVNPTGNGTWFPASTNEITITSDTHPVLVEAGVSNGAFTVYNQLTNFTNLERTVIGKESSSFGAGIDILATGSGTEATFATIWAADQGDALFTGTAANRIFAMPLPGDEAGQNIPAADIRDEYWAIFDAAMNWLAPLAPNLNRSTTWTMFE